MNDLLLLTIRQSQESMVLQRVATSHLLKCLGTYTLVKSLQSLSAMELESTVASLISALEQDLLNSLDQARKDLDSFELILTLHVRKSTNGEEMSSTNVSA